MMHLNDEGFLYIEHAIASGSLIVVKTIVEQMDKDYVSNHVIPLQIAIDYGYTDIAKYLLVKGANLDEIDETDILKCMASDYVEMLEFLLGKIKFDQETIDDTFVLSYGCNSEVVQVLIDFGADVDKYGNKVCAKAKKHENHHLVKYLEEIIKNDNDDSDFY